MLGIYLWRQVQTVVQLTKNQRQASDPVYGGLLSRVRLGQCRDRAVPGESQGSDADIIYRRLLQQVVRRDPEAMGAFEDAPVIVGTKALRDVLNARIIHHKARSMNQEVHTYHSSDKINKTPVCGEMRSGLWKLPTSVCEDSLGKLPLFPGMKVMIRENIAFSKRLVNGAEGTVVDIVYEESDNVRYAVVVYVRVPGAGKVADDLDEDIVPVFPETVSFKCKMNVGGEITMKYVSRKQIPLLPAYAYTDYKSQGKSLTRAIVDIDSANSLQGIYVMLSRVRSLDGLLVLRPFSVAKLCGRLSQELRRELARIDALAEATTARYKARGHERDNSQHRYLEQPMDTGF